HVLAKTEEEALAWAKEYFGYFPSNCDQAPPRAEPKAPKASGKRIDEIIPKDQNKPFNIKHFIEEIIDEGSMLEIHKLFAREIVTCLARLDGKPVGIIANQPNYKGGVLFVDSADK